MTEEDTTGTATDPRSPSPKPPDIKYGRLGPEAIRELRAANVGLTRLLRLTDDARGDAVPDVIEQVLRLKIALRRMAAQQEQDCFWTREETAPIEADIPL